ncbi:hypothetical protein [Paludifilum halophilum]|uniref:hypothetical protein n=1 Tax=Paludifilum halophilum TaxID=1642702 RepID=UPI00114026DB|nr:hypothetical protein [Paludifilum halophilum]
MAAQGLRNTTDHSLPFRSETEPIEDEKERAIINRQARKVHLQTLVTSVLLMIVVILITGL